MVIIVRVLIVVIVVVIVVVAAVTFINVVLIALTFTSKKAELVVAKLIPVDLIPELKLAKLY